MDIWVFLKGMLMGAADIVPGVSGGTIAFITGIYERLLAAIKNFLPSLFSFFKHRQFRQFWESADLAFLVTLLAGILVSVLTLAKGISFLLETHPILIWSFFFGLIIASVVIVAKQVPQWSISVFSSLVLGVIFAWGVTSALPGEIEATSLTIFLSGALAICAMILPGISGSFILLIIGTYGFILSALKGFDLQVLAIFMAGCVVGILSIANILSWAFKRYRALTLSLLTGFMIGALNKVWPWKEVLSYRLDRHGEQVPLEQINVLPWHYELATGLSAQLLPAIILALFALVLVLVLESISKKA